MIIMAKEDNQVGILCCSPRPNEVLDRLTTMVLPVMFEVSIMNSSLKLQDFRVLLRDGRVMAARTKLKQDRPSEDVFPKCSSGCEQGFRGRKSGLVGGLTPVGVQLPCGLDCVHGKHVANNVSNYM